MCQTRIAPVCRAATRGVRQVILVGRIVGLGTLRSGLEIGPGDRAWRSGLEIGPGDRGGTSAYQPRPVSPDLDHFCFLRSAVRVRRVRQDVRGPWGCQAIAPHDRCATADESGRVTCDHKRNPLIPGCMSRGAVAFSALRGPRPSLCRWCHDPAGDPSRGDLLLQQALPKRRGSLGPTSQKRGSLG
jgi:hypothetical protein